MSTKTDLLQLLTQNEGNYLSGQKIGESLNVSRNAIWKAMNQLKKDGYQFDSRPGVGYALLSCAKSLNEDVIKGNLNYPCDLFVYDSTESTNDDAKKMEPGTKPVFIVANRQTKGRGRLGRTFESPRGSGLYMTVLLRPHFEIDKALYVTMAVAVAVNKAIAEVCGTETGIKWVNDIFYKGRKVCGILTEAQSNFETGRIDNLIIGIGINCFPGSFPPDIAHIAGCLSEKPGSFSRDLLAAEVFNQVVKEVDNLDSMEFMDAYRDKCFIIGREVFVHPHLNDEKIRAEVLGVDSRGALLVRYLEGENQGKEAALTTGEVSVRLE